MTLEEQQNIFLQHIPEEMKKKITIKERLSEAFTAWFQGYVEPPKAPTENTQGNQQNNPEAPSV